MAQATSDALSAASDATAEAIGRVTTPRSREDAWGNSLFGQPSVDFRGRGQETEEQLGFGTGQDPALTISQFGSQLIDGAKTLIPKLSLPKKPDVADGSSQPTLWQTSEELETTVDTLDTSRPFGSARTTALQGRERIGEQDDEYASARGHGLAKGYHLYTSAPLPVEAEAYAATPSPRGGGGRAAPHALLLTPIPPLCPAAPRAPSGS